VISHTNQNIILLGGFNPFGKILVSWDYYSYGKIKNVANHQPEYIYIYTITYYTPIMAILSHHFTLESLYRSVNPIT